MERLPLLSREMPSSPGWGERRLHIQSTGVAGGHASGTQSDPRAETEPASTRTVTSLESPIERDRPSPSGPEETQVPQYNQDTNFVAHNQQRPCHLSFLVRPGKHASSRNRGSRVSVFERIGTGWMRRKGAARSSFDELGGSGPWCPSRCLRAKQATTSMAPAASGTVGTYLKSTVRGRDRALGFSRGVCGQSRLRHR